MNTRTRTIIAALAATLSLSAGMTGIASAAGEPKVTIQYNGSGFEGKIKNVKPRCLEDRQVNVFKANGQKMYSDTTETDGSWNTGNSGQVRGKFYSKVKADGSCGKLVSKTIRATPTL